MIICGHRLSKIAKERKLTIESHVIELHDGHHQKRRPLSTPKKIPSEQASLSLQVYQFF